MTLTADKLMNMKPINNNVLLKRLSEESPDSLIIKPKEAHGTSKSRYGEIIAFSDKASADIGIANEDLKVKPVNAYFERNVGIEFSFKDMETGLWQDFVIIKLKNLLCIED